MNIYSTYNNDSSRYYDAFQNLLLSFQATQDVESGPTSHLNNDCCGQLSPLAADYDENVTTTKDHTPPPPDSLRFQESQETDSEFKMRLENEVSPDLASSEGGQGATSLEMACHQWYTDLLVTQSHGQSEFIVDEYYGYLKGALEKTLVELNIPSTYHFACYSNLADNLAENEEIHQTVRYKLIEIPRAVELMDLLGIV